MSLSEASAESFAAPARRVQRDRYFYSIAALILLLFLVSGFHRFYLEGKGFDGQAVPGAILGFVVAHGITLSLWVVLFFVQSALVATKNRRLHMKLGWAGAIDGLAVAITGPVMAVVSVRFRENFPIFGMTYRQFLLPMLTEIVAFTAFVGLGVYFRKRNLGAHRAMMLLATLAVISGATSRTQFLAPIFPDSSWFGLYGPPFILGALFLAGRSFLIRSLDRPLAAGYTALVAFYLIGVFFSGTSGWAHIAASIVGR